MPVSILVPLWRDLLAFWESFKLGGAHLLQLGLRRTHCVIGGSVFVRFAEGFRVVSICLQSTAQIVVGAETRSRLLLVLLQQEAVHPASIAKWKLLRYELTDQQRARGDCL